MKKGARIPVWGVDVLAVLACAGAAAAAYVAVVQPQSTAADEVRIADQRHAELEERATAAQSELNSQERVIKELREKLAEGVTLQPVAKLNDRLTRLADLADRVAKAKTVEGGPVALRIDQVTPSPAQKLDTYHSVAIRMAGTATYGAAVEFLSELHLEFRDMQVTGLRLASNETNEAQPTGKDAAAAAAAAANGPVRATFWIDIVWYAAQEKRPDPAGEKATVPAK